MTLDIGDRTNLESVILNDQVRHYQLSKGTASISKLLSSIEVGGLSFNFKIKQEITIFRVFFRSILGLVKKNLL